MTANCTFSTSSGYFLRITSGTFTVNGNGYTINADSNARAFDIRAGATLILNNVTITGLNDTSRQVIQIFGVNAYLDADNVTFRNNTTRNTLIVGTSARVDLDNVRFENNTGTGSREGALDINAAATVNLGNAIFTNNTGTSHAIWVTGNGTTLNVTGCLTFSGNTGNIGTETTPGNVPTVNNNNIGACVGGGFTTATPALPPATATAAAAETATAAGTATAAAAETATAAAAETATAAGTATVLAMTATSTSTPTSTLTPTPTDTPDSVVPPAPSDPRTSEKKKDPPSRPTPTATPRPAYAASYTALQTETGMTFEAAYGLESGVHFRQLDGGGIGIQSIIDAGPLAALDVYGYVEQGVEVCFPQIGRVIFLDARTMPRAITTLPATVKDGMTCVYLDSPGSLVLLPN